MVHDPDMPVPERGRLGFPGRRHGYAPPARLPAPTAADRRGAALLVIVLVVAIVGLVLLSPRLGVTHHQGRVVVRVVASVVEEGTGRPIAGAEFYVAQRLTNLQSREWRKYARTMRHELEADNRRFGEHAIPVDRTSGFARTDATGAVEAFMGPSLCWLGDGPAPRVTAFHGVAAGLLLVEDRDPQVILTDRGRWVVATPGEAWDATWDLGVVTVPR